MLPPLNELSSLAYPLLFNRLLGRNKKNIVVRNFVLYDTVPLGGYTPYSVDDFSLKLLCMFVNYVIRDVLVGCNEYGVSVKLQDIRFPIPFSELIKKVIGIAFVFNVQP